MIPEWNISAVLPPIRPGALGHSPDRSPYSATIYEVVDRFATSAERIQILRGLLNYRAELRQRGIQSGFQWLDGSFLEHKEILEGESPNDVDVVTFFHLPEGENQTTFAPQVSDLFDNNNTKARYRVDAFPQVLGNSMSESDVRSISYWYSMWSHRRNGVWKGFVQVDISGAEDDIAAALISQKEQELVTP